LSGALSRQNVKASTEIGESLYGISQWEKEIPYFIATESLTEIHQYYIIQGPYALGDIQLFVLDLLAANYFLPQPTQIGI